jgi:hypothetical protein
MNPIVIASRYDVLPYAIQRLQQAGYQLVTVAECLGRAPYQSVGSPQTPDVSLPAKPSHRAHLAHLGLRIVDLALLNDPLGNAELKGPGPASTFLRFFSVK